ncbi:MAG: inner membrane protein [Verrucomicrobiales bacterium]|jgi:inner membrane protein
MDPISQGVIGAVAAVSLAKNRESVRLAGVTGWIGGILADADIVIRSASDPLLAIEYHRHFTHSLLFIPIGGLLAAAFCWALFRGRRSYRDCALFGVAGYATSGLLDACTSYGTQLWWPFSSERVAWNIISIVDPIFTITLVILFIVAVIRRSRTCARWAAGFALAYLALGVVQNTRASRVQAGIIAQRGHAGADMATVKPSIGNLVLWRSIYRHEGTFHVDAVRVGLTGSERTYVGTSVPALDADALKRDLPPASTLANDLDRFDHFSSRYLAHHPDQPEVLGDFRYAMLPNSAVPLWGIRYDPAQPDHHVRFESFRSVRKEQRHELFRMILGKD